VTTNWSRVRIGSATAQHQRRGCFRVAIVRKAPLNGRRKAVRIPRDIEHDASQREPDLLRVGIRLCGIRHIGPASSGHCSTRRGSRGLPPPSARVRRPRRHSGWTLASSRPGRTRSRTPARATPSAGVTSSVTSAVSPMVSVDPVVCARLVASRRSETAALRRLKASVAEIVLTRSSVLAPGAWSSGCWSSRQDADGSLCPPPRARSHRRKVSCSAPVYSSTARAAIRLSPRRRWSARGGRSFPSCAPRRR
jgi:hypothetical protein